MEIALIISAVVVLLWLNILSSYRVHGSVSISEKQKKYQYLIIWCLPLLGALLVLAVSASDHANLKPESLDGVPKNRAVGFMLSVLLLDFHTSSASGDVTAVNGSDLGDP